MKNETTCTSRGMRERSVEKQREGGRTYLQVSNRSRKTEPRAQYKVQKMYYEGYIFICSVPPGGYSTSLLQVLYPEKNSERTGR